MSEREPTPEEVFGEEPKPVATTVPRDQWPIPHTPGLRDPAIRAKAIAAKNINTAARRRKAESTRADLSADFLADMHQLWKDHGKTIIARAAFAHPEKMAKIFADLLPKQLEVKGSAVQDIEDDRLVDLIDALSERLGRGVETAAGAFAGRSTATVIDAEVVELQALPEAK